MATQLSATEFEELYRQTAAQLFGFFRRRGVVDPADLVAEVFTIAWRSRSKLPGAELRRAWLFGTARRLLLAEFRHRAQERERDEVLARQPDPELQSDATDERHQAILAALARLRPDERELILLVEWERLTPAEAAQALGIKPGTARVRLHRARQALAADAQLQALLAIEVTA